MLDRTLFPLLGAGGRICSKSCLRLLHLANRPGDISFGQLSSRLRGRGLRIRCNRRRGGPFRSSSYLLQGLGQGLLPGLELVKRLRIFLEV